MADARANAGMAEVYPILLGSALAPRAQTAFAALSLVCAFSRSLIIFALTKWGRYPIAYPSPNRLRFCVSVFG